MPAPKFFVSKEVKDFISDFFFADNELSKKIISRLGETGDFRPEEIGLEKILKEKFGDDFKENFIIPTSQLLNKDRTNLNEAQLLDRIKFINERILEPPETAVDDNLLKSKIIDAAIQEGLTDELPLSIFVEKVFNKFKSGNREFDFDLTPSGQRAIDRLLQGNIVGESQVPTSTIFKNEDLKSFQDLLSKKQTKRESEEKVENFLSSLPQTLKKQREQFLSGEQNRARDIFQEQIVPRTLESLNTRGLIDSGFTEDLLSTQAVDIQSQLASSQFQLESEDNQFYFNSAYQNKVRKLLESNVNLQSSLSAEQSNILNKKEESFKSEQNKLNQRFQFQLNQREAERQLKVEEQRQIRNFEQQERDRRSNLFGKVGSALGAAAGATIGGLAGGPVGAGIGLGIGSGFGGVAGGLAE